MFEITTGVIEQALVPSKEAGAQVVFTGVVRDHNEGQAVESLEYEAHESLAISEGETIIAEARSRFEIEDAHCVHRVGHLQIGDVAVMVAVTAAHRKAAFDACQYIIDEVKSRVPIWKREVYTDGKTEWLGAGRGTTPAK